MARMNNNSHDIRRWSMSKLIAELNIKANFTHFGCNDVITDNRITGERVRQATELYRRTWVQPLIEEIARRTVK